MKYKNNDEAKKGLLYLSLKYNGNWDLIHSHLGKDILDEKYLEAQIKKMKFKYVTILDEEYPNQLKSVYKPPFVIYYYGDLNLLKSQKILAIAGSRDISSYSKDACNKIISELEDKTIVILSGLARGCDTIGLTAARDNGLKMVGILGTGIDYCYPKENYELYAHIKKEGLLISEYPYKEVVSKHNFTFRNRLVASLSNAIFVPQVKDRSGTIVTIKYGVNLGKDILVIPTSIFEDTCNNQLLKLGAALITSGKDIEEAIF